MPENEKPHFTEMARPRGRKYQSISFSLTLDQIAYLDNQPNPSQLIRRLLSEHMEQILRPEADDTLGSLKVKLENAKREKAALEEEYEQWEDDHEEELYENGWRHYNENDKLAFKRGARVDRLIAIMRDYDRRLEELNKTISTLEQAITEGERST